MLTAWLSFGVCANSMIYRTSLLYSRPVRVFFRNTSCWKLVVEEHIRVGNAEVNLIDTETPRSFAGGMTLRTDLIEPSPWFCSLGSFRIRLLFAKIARLWNLKVLISMSIGLKPICLASLIQSRMSRGGLVFTNVKSIYLLISFYAPSLGKGSVPVWAQKSRQEPI